MGKVENELWLKVQRVKPLLRLVPFVRLVAVCNNLSFGTVNEGSDIDLFIVAKSGRLFFVRTVVTCLLQLFGVRRHGKKVAGRFCLSFFVDDDALDLSTIALKNDIYLGFWLCYLVPIVADDLIVDELWDHNKWIRRFFERNEFIVKGDSFFGSKPWVVAFFEFIFGGFLGDFLETALRKWQISRAKKKAVLVNDGSLVINEHMLKFHNIDRRREYRGRWYRMYRDEKLTLDRLRRACF